MHIDWNGWMGSPGTTEQLIYIDYQLFMFSLSSGMLLERCISTVNCSESFCIHLYIFSSRYRSIIYSLQFSRIYRMTIVDYRCLWTDFSLGLMISALLTAIRFGPRRTDWRWPHHFPLLTQWLPLVSILKTFSSIIEGVVINHFGWYR